jgi:hypothetical protein
LDRLPNADPEDDVERSSVSEGGLVDEDVVVEADESDRTWDEEAEDDDERLCGGGRVSEVNRFGKRDMEWRREGGKRNGKVKVKAKQT